MYNLYIRTVFPFSSVTRGHFIPKMIKYQRAGVAEWQTRTTQNRVRLKSRESSTLSLGTNYMSLIIEGLQRPDLKHPDTWATIAEVHQKWLRIASPQMGFDTKKIILGDVLGTIYGDDPNCFGLIYLPSLSHEGKKHLQIRMDFEINTPELPEQIRSRIKEIKPKVLSLDWTNESGHKQARKLWMEKVRNYVQHQIALHPEYREAEAYYNSVAELLSTPYQEFLGNP